MSFITISQRLFTPLFWELVLSRTDAWFSEMALLKTHLNNLEKGRSQADYNTGSINFSSAWSLYCLARHFKTQKVLEIGTFIGKSTISIAKAIEDELGAGEIYTCDVSNSIDLDYTGPVKIRQFKKTMSADMIGQLCKEDKKVDLVFIDGRLSSEEIPNLVSLLKDNTIVALDDFEGIEKGVFNFQLLRSIPPFDKYMMSYPPDISFMAKYGITSNNSTACFIPRSLIQLTAQG